MADCPVHSQSDLISLDCKTYWYQTLWVTSIKGDLTFSPP